MKLSELCRALKVNGSPQGRDPEVTRLIHDSRQVKPGHLFVAVSGYQQDGHAYAAAAVQQGAVAVVAERRIDLPAHVPQVIVGDAREALSALSDCFFGRPSAALGVCGVTGTKGKTTTTFLIRAISEAAGNPTGMLGTVTYRIGRREIRATATTPESVEIHDYLAQMLREGLSHAVIEASSHALVMHRVSHVRFRAAVLTNVTPNEHTDFHKTFEDYRAAKARLFDGLEEGQAAVLNRDDPNFEYFRSRTGGDVVSYGLGEEADVHGRILRSSMKGTTVQISVYGRIIFDVTTPLVGRHNVSNVLAATAAALSLGISEGVIQRALAELPQVPGRLEPIACGQDFSVLVDYAHTADSLRSVLTTLREMAEGRLIVCFGCGGNRDRTKRKLMGQAASELADHVWITSDNSRNERTEDIISEVEQGLVHRDRHHACPDRAEAVRGAIDMAGTGDIVLLAGKGHETVQIIGDVAHPFDDRQVAREAIQNRLQREAWRWPFSSVAAM